MRRRAEAYRTRKALSLLCSGGAIQTGEVVKRKKENLLKSFIVGLVKKQTLAQQSQASLKSFIIELVIFAGLVVTYFFLVLTFLVDWIKGIYDQSKPLYALVALVLIASQGVVLELISVLLMKVVELWIE